jgi:hypothetical protein
MGCDHLNQEEDCVKMGRFDYVDWIELARDGRPPYVDPLC